MGFPAFLHSLPLISNQTCGSSSCHSFLKRPTSPALHRRNCRPSIVSARLKDSSNELETKLLASVTAIQEGLKSGESSLHRFKKRNPGQFEDVAAQVSELERTVVGFGSTSSKLKPLMAGKWQLMLTDSIAVEKNAGSVTGLGSLPGAKCLEVYVILESGGSARTVEKIKVFGFLDGENVLEGKWCITGQGVLEVTYARAILMGKAKIRADSKAVLRTTYCSQELRLGRSQSGEFYVFVKR